MKLTSMTDKVLEKIEFYNYRVWDDDLQGMSMALNNIENYANFLKQPIKLEYFVACDLEGNVLEKPVNYSAFEVGMSGKDFGFNFIDCQQYQEAQSRVLFEGFKIEHHENQDYSIRCENSILNVFWKQGQKDWYLSHGIKTIEDLVKYSPTITQSAINQIK